MYKDLIKTKKIEVSYVKVKASGKFFVLPAMVTTDNFNHWQK